MDPSVTLNEVLKLAEQLPLVEKVRLIERIAPQIERDIRITRSKRRKSLRGLWRGLGTSEEDIAEARREMWDNFPREDI